MLCQMQRYNDYYYVAPITSSCDFHSFMYVVYYYIYNFHSMVSKILTLQAFNRLND